MRDLEILAAAGCRFVRLAKREKRPLGAAWQTKSTCDLTYVNQWLAAGNNVGLLLGPASGVVDVEFDDADGLEQLAAFGITDLHTPTWRSARGEHRLFRWEPWMPQTAVVKADSLEIRIGGRAAQSVLPPSVHPTGQRYEWIVPPSACSIAPFPAQLLRGLPCVA
jgi:Bifunctional DNA primase/polymerase, N-terminal